MSNDRVIIRHADGREYSVTPEAWAKSYPDFELVGAETPDAFVVKGVKAPRRRKSPGAKNAKPIAVPVVEDDSDAEGEPV
jgi:hypothetical protein